MLNRSHFLAPMVLALSLCVLLLPHGLRAQESADLRVGTEEGVEEVDVLTSEGLEMEPMEMESMSENNHLERGVSIGAHAMIGTLLGMGVGTSIGFYQGQQQLKSLYPEDEPWVPGQLLGYGIVGGFTLIIYTGTGLFVGTGTGAVLGTGTGVVRSRLNRLEPTKRSLSIQPIIHPQKDRSLYGFGLNGTF